MPKVVGIGKIDFFCRRCAKDLSLSSERKQCKDGEEAWVSRCPSCKDLMVRIIGGTKTDPFFRYSKRVRKEREQHAKYFNTAPIFTHGQSNDTNGDKPGGSGVSSQ